MQRRWAVRYGALGILVFKEKLHSCELNKEVWEKEKRETDRKERARARWKQGSGKNIFILWWLVVALEDACHGGPCLIRLESQFPNHPFDGPWLNSGYSLPTTCRLMPVSSRGFRNPSPTRWSNMMMGTEFQLRKQKRRGNQYVSSGSILEVPKGCKRYKFRRILSI